MAAGGNPGKDAGGSSVVRPVEDRWAVDPSRGYAFATFRLGATLVGFYSVDLKSNPIRGGDQFQQLQLNILKRELAAEQSMAHAAEMEKTFPGVKLVVGGDFNTNTDQKEFVSERTLGIFTAAGFLSCWGDLPLPKRITHPGKGRYPDATFDYLWFKGLKSVGAPETTRSSLSDYYPVTAELEITR